ALFDEENAMTLENRTALITGASRGLGRALACALAARHAKVVLTARPSDELDQLAADLRAQGARAFALPADIGDKRAIFPLAGEAAALAGPIDILINNASALGPTPLRFLLDTECEAFERAFAVNVLGPFRLSKAVLGSMLLRDRGVIINISSDAAIEAYSTWGVYGATKASLDQLTRIWASELGESRVRLLSVDPGEMDTAMHALAIPDADRSALAKPEAIARRIVEMIEQPERAPNGARLSASEWRTS
ncbi:MAG TPA: SDR family oxidoreductase, partial [Polyangiales bacterium]|nr:SDR family oxidoreductase [Polyangiales bacterium]